jgi:hypothetical protein
VQCHQELEAELQQPVKLSSSDVHFAKGLSCHSCHGGDPGVGIDTGGPEDSMSRAKGYIGKPDRARVVALCASCHSKLEFMRTYNPQARVDQHAEYRTSVHGKLYDAGDPRVATCIDCHGAHGIRTARDPQSPVYATNVGATCARCHADAERMAAYKIPTDQLAQYTRSIHGEALLRKRDLSAPTCNDCHGNHGAAPPGVDAVANVCGQCHASQWDLFIKSPHSKAFSEGGLPACVTCHEHHGVHQTSDALIGVEDASPCVTCHDAGTPGYRAAAAMKSGLVGLQTRLDAARHLLERAERAGMEVSKPLFELTEGRARLVRARVEVHRFDASAIAPVVNEGEAIAAAAARSGTKALEELAFRRKGLAVSVVILLAMIALVVAKIRQIEAAPGREAGPHGAGH